MRTEGGKTVGRTDPSFKRRADVTIADEGLKNHLRDAIRFRLAPEILKVFQFNVTRIERYIVACYDSGSGGFFRPSSAMVTSARRLKLGSVRPTVLPPSVRMKPDSLGWPCS